MKLIYFKSALKCDSFDIAIDIKIKFFRVLVTIEPGRSLLQFVTTNCLMYGEDDKDIFNFLGNCKELAVMKNKWFYLVLTDRRWAEGTGDHKLK